MATEGQSLADFQRGELSLEDFEWESHLRPSPTSLTREAAEAAVPVVDLAGLFCKGPDALKYAEMVGSLAEAASTHGFFQVFNHGIRIGALESLYAYGRNFFSLPLDRKYEASKFTAHPTAGPSGYVCGNSSSSLNKWWSEGIRFPSQDKAHMHTLASSFCPDQQELQHFSDILEECSLGFSRLAKQLIILLLEGLGLKGEEVSKRYVDDGGIATLKLTRYPPCPQPDKTLGLPPHSDVSIITVVWQDQVGGLQVKLNGEWVTIKPRLDALVVNIGDIFQVWSNDQYLSGQHRVILNSEKSRYSMTYFYSGVETMLMPLPEVLVKRKACSKFRSTLISKHRHYAYLEVGKGEWKGVDYLKIDAS
ncbi:hypothetical protein L7F22_045719 [Adiantum nelumboides]|nr:hypothetical protein [Adiantum nelumboides]